MIDYLMIPDKGIFVRRMPSASLANILRKNTAANVFDQAFYGVVTHGYRRQQVNFLDYLDSLPRFSAAEYRSLRAIARLCPRIEGFAVYKATALLAQVEPLALLKLDRACRPDGGVELQNRQMHPGIDQGPLTWSIHLYPNPARDQVQIRVTPAEEALTATGDTELPGLSIEIYNTLGQRVLEKPLVIGENTLDTHSLVPRVYTCKYKTHAGYDDRYARLLIQR